MDRLFDRRISRRELLRALGLLGTVVVVEGCAPAATPTPTPAPTKPPPTAVPTKPPATATPKPRPDWALAAAPYRGRKVAGLAPAADFPQRHLGMTAEFTKATGIEVEWELVESGNPYWTKLEVELRGGGGNFDFVAVDASRLTLYGKAGMLVPLDEYFTNPDFPDIDVADIPQNIMSYLGRRDGKTLALPCNMSVQTSFYRKDLLDEAGLKPPKDWVELYEAAKKMRKGDVYGAAWELKGRYPGLRFGNALPPGLTWLDKDLKPSALRDPRTIENMAIWQRMFKEGLIPPDSLSNDLVTTQTIFTTGRSASLPIAWPEQVVTIENPEKSQVVGKVISAVMPGGQPNATGWAYGISADAKQKEAAYLFVSWLTGKPGATKELLDYAVVVGCRTSTMLSEEVKQMWLKRPHGATELQAYQVRSDSLPGARFAPEIAQWSGDCINAISPIFQQIIAGELTPEVGMNQAADAIEKILAAAGYYKT